MARGVGSRIKDFLTRRGIVPHDGCGCEELARELDEAGVDEVERRIDYFAEKMQNNVRKWKRGGIRTLIPTPPLIVIKQFLQWAIEEERLHSQS